MSSFVKSLPHHELSYNARELACHFADTYSKRLKGKLLYNTEVKEMVNSKAQNKRNEYKVEPVLSGHSKKDQKLVFKTDFHLMQVKSCSLGAFSNTFDLIKLLFVIKTFVFSIFEWCRFEN